KVFNGNFIAASRLLFAMGRRGLIDPRLAQIHPVNQTPALAVICVGAATSACMFLGTAILVPISEVGSVASATGWTAACLAYLCMKPSPRDRGLSYGADENRSDPWTLRYEGVDRARRLGSFGYRITEAHRLGEQFFKTTRGGSFEDPLSFDLCDCTLPNLSAGISLFRASADGCALRHRHHSWPHHR